MGAVTAANVLAMAAFKEGKFSQAFAAFGPERRGAPVTAFCRIAEKPIRLRQQVYEPDIVVILEENLIATEHVTEGLKKNGIIIVNSKDDLSKELHNDKFKGNIYRVDATHFALEYLQKPIVNTAILGALVKATDIVTLDSLKAALEERFEGVMKDANVKAMEASYKECFKCQVQ